MAKTIDLTYPLSAETTMYPGLPQPEITPYFTVENEGANVTRISFISHTGTHIDAPRHMLAGTQTVDEISLDRLVGEAVVVDVSARKDPTLITLSDLRAHDNAILAGDILLLITGIHTKYGTPAYADECPGLAPDAARWLVEKQIACYATDATSIEVPGSEGHPAHKILLGHEIPIIENLANLGELTAGRVQFIALPLKVKNGDGSPCRVVVIEE